ncbi:MAG: hypothetical protein Q8R53_04100 [Nanoarchaeota archaeon]|nr:hypothetical protein [Nanoarchaeota archaeon]
MLKKVFLATLILTLFVASSLLVVIAAEGDTGQEKIETLTPTSVKIIVSEEPSNQVFSNQGNLEYLEHLMRKIKRDVKRIPAVAVPLY